MGKSKGRAAKKPRTRVDPPGGKHPRVAPSAEPKDDQRPTWRFGLCDYDGPWSWDWDAFVGHLDKLMHIESTPWPVSARGGTIGIKRIPIENLDAAAQRQLRRIDLDDFDLHEIRVSGAGRFWGVRLGHCFQFLWWDPNHTVCPTKR